MVEILWVLGLWAIVQTSTFVPAIRYKSGTWLTHNASPGFSLLSGSLWAVE